MIAYGVSLKMKMSDRRYNLEVEGHGQKYLKHILKTYPQLVMRKLLLHF